MSGSALEAFGRKIITEADQVLALLESKGLQDIKQARSFLKEYLNQPIAAHSDGPPCLGCQVGLVRLTCGKKVWACLADMGCIHGKR